MRMQELPIQNLARSNVERFAAMVLATAFSCGIARGQATSANSIVYQGKVSGIVGPTVDLTVRFFDSLTGGAQIGPTLSLPSQPCNDGIFTATISPVDQFLFKDPSCYLDLSLNGTAVVPRQLVSATPYAQSAINLIGAPGVPPEFRSFGAAVNADGIRSWSYAQLHSMSSTQYSGFQQAIPCGDIGYSGSFIPTGVQLYAALGAAFQKTMGFGFYSNWYSNLGRNGDWASAVVWIREGYNNVFDVVHVKESENFDVKSKNWLLRVSTNGETSNRGLAVYDSNDVRTFSVSGQGVTTTKVLTITGGSDVAEPIGVTDLFEPVQPGMVMVIDREHDGKLVPCTAEYDKAVAGVISGANGVHPGLLLQAEGQPHVAGGENTMPLAMSGRVWVLCDASSSPIRRGDSLTTSATPGHAMTVKDESLSSRAVIGKAMTELREGHGLVLVLVNLQ